MRADALAAVAGEHAATVRVVRGHLELSGVTTVAALSARTTLPAEELVIALAALEHEGFAMQGRYRADTAGTSGSRGGCWRACTATRSAPAGRASKR